MTTCMPIKMTLIDGNHTNDHASSNDTNTTSTDSPTTENASASIVVAAPAVNLTKLLSTTAHPRLACIVLCAVIESFLVAGILFGWSSFIVIFKHEYLELCDPGETSCHAQSLAFSLAYTVGSIVFTVMFFVWGVVLDRFGLSICHATASIMIWIGIILLIFFDSKHFNCLVPAMAFIAGGGPGVYVSLLNVSAVSSRYGSAIVACISAAFDASALMGVLLSTIADATSRQGTFIGFAILASIVVGNSFWIWTPKRLNQFKTELAAIETTPDAIKSEVKTEKSIPPSPRPTVGDIELGVIPQLPPASTPSPISTSTESCDDAIPVPSASPTPSWDAIEPKNEENITAATNTTHPTAKSMDPPVKAATPSPSSDRCVLPFLTVLQSWPLWLVIFVTTVFYLRVAFYYGSVTLQLESYSGVSSSQADHYTLIFTILVSVCSLAAPFIGWVKDRYGIAGAFTLAQSLVLIFSITMLIPILEVQIVTFLAIGLARCFTYPTIFYYLTTLYGFEHIGKTNGLSVVISGAISAVQYPMLESALHGSGFESINIGLLVCSSITFLSIGGMWLLPLLRSPRSTMVTINSTS